MLTIFCYCYVSGTNPDLIEDRKGQLQKYLDELLQCDDQATLSQIFLDWLDTSADVCLILTAIITTVAVTR
jgi:hypothetical protein